MGVVEIMNEVGQRRGAGDCCKAEVIYWDIMTAWRLLRLLVVVIGGGRESEHKGDDAPEGADETCRTLSTTATATRTRELAAERGMDKLQKGKVALGLFRSYIPDYLIRKIITK